MTNVVKSIYTSKVIRSNVSRKVVNSKVNFSMDTTRFKFNQTPVETPNGVLKVFTLPSSETYVSGLLEIFVDGLLQIKTTDYSETTSSTFTFVNAPDSDENIRINYIKS